MAYQFILYGKEDGVAIITLNQPDKRNAWHSPMKAEIMHALDDANADDGVGAIIVTGSEEGRAFSSGATMAPPGAKVDFETMELVRHGQVGGDTDQLVEKIIDLDKPIIAAINGVVAGAPISLACACDFRIASDQARFCMAFGRRGLVPGVCSTYWLTRLIGTAQLLELAYTNVVIDAKEMERIGLVNKVVPHDQLISHCKELYQKMKVIPPITLTLTRKMALKNHELKKGLEEQRLWDHWGAGVVHATEDRKEAEKSWIEKRDPVYKRK
ncbi:MAG: enoyl-CoA hydratase-related protein [Dehalococcoidales bacterium]|nr:enoyl-CoA hydratase-related protein [Dehalococcoidales bacterium]